MTGNRTLRVSLRTRIILWSFIPTAIILAAVALVIYVAYVSLTENLVIDRNKELARLSAIQVTTDLAGYAELLTSVARTTDIYQEDAEAQVAALERAHNRLIIFDGGVLILDHYGRVVATDPERPELAGADWSNRPYFRQALRTRAAVFSDILTDGAQGASVIAVAVPLLGEQDEFHGALVGQFQLGVTSVSTFYGGIVRQRVVGGGSMYLVDASGRAIYHPNDAVIGQDLHLQPAVEHALGGRVGYLRAPNAAGRDSLASYAPVPGTGWALVAEEDWDALLASSGTYGRSLLLLLGLGIVVPVIVVTLGVRRITGPIAKLIAAAQDIAGGRFGQQITVHTGDEMEELVTHFNRMSARLAESYAVLKAREERLDLVMRGTNDGIWDWDARTNDVYLSPRWKAMLGYTDADIENAREFLTSIVHPDDLPLAERMIRAQMQEPAFSFELRMRHKDSTYRWFLARGFALRDESGEPYRVAGSHADITESKQAHAALEQAYATLEHRVEERTREIERRRQVAEGLRETLAVLNSQRPLGEILDHIVCQAGKLLGSDAASIARMREKSGPLVIQAACGLDADYVKQIEIPLGQGAEGSAVASRRPIAIANTPGALEWLLENARHSEVHRALMVRLVERFHAVLSVPMYSKDEPYGALTLYYREARPFSEEEIELAVSLANQAALALENARLREQAEQSAVAAERGRLARDLHDAVTQSLYSVTLYAEASARLLAAGNVETATEHLYELRDTAQEALREMRLLIFELRPPALEKTGLAAALQARLESVEERGGISARLLVVGQEDVRLLPPAQQQEIYHIAQEALNNVLKHAHAHHVRVQLDFNERATRLEVVDDGRGFAPAASSGGLGLRGMRERAQRIGAVLSISSAPDQGTTVSLAVPVAAAAAVGE